MVAFYCLTCWELLIFIKLRTDKNEILVKENRFDDVVSDMKHHRIMIVIESTLTDYGIWVIGMEWQNRSGAIGVTESETMRQS